MATAAPLATVSPLRGHLEKYGVPAAVVTYITSEQGGIGLETISDFANLFAESDYEACERMVPLSGVATLRS